MRNEFNNKAKDYANGRPTYPKEILDKLIELGIDKNSNIADIGAGTGLLFLMQYQYHILHQKLIRNIMNL